MSCSSEQKEFIGSGNSLMFLEVEFNSCRVLLDVAFHLSKMNCSMLLQFQLASMNISLSILIRELELILLYFQLWLSFVKMSCLVLLLISCMDKWFAIIM